MPSSLIIVALAGAWLVVLVPMVARRRQEVASTAGDVAMTSRVLSRRREPDVDEREETPMPDQDTELDRAAVDEVDTAEVDAPEDAQDGADFDEEEFDERAATEQARTRYRPGRGGFDPEAAELAAKAKYTVRQRIVVGLMATVVITALLGAVALPAAWYVCAVAAVAFVGYLAYLRRQVSIETAIRRRRMERLGGAGRPKAEPEYDDADYDYDEYPADDVDLADDVLGNDDRHAPEPESMAPVRRELPPRRQQRGVVVDLDDEDPSFYELSGERGYRRAVGE